MDIKKFYERIEEIAEFFTGSNSENNGIISKIIEQDTIEVKKVTEECIAYEITATDLSNMFQDVMQETIPSLRLSAQRYQLNNL